MGNLFAISYLNFTIIFNYILINKVHLFFNFLKPRIILYSCNARITNFQITKRDLFIIEENCACTFTCIAISCTLNSIQMMIDLDLLHFVDLVISCYYIPQLAKLMVEINKKQNLFNLKRIDVNMIKKNRV